MKPLILLLIFLLPVMSADPIRSIPDYKPVNPDYIYSKRFTKIQINVAEDVLAHMKTIVGRKAIESIERFERGSEVSVVELTLIHGDCQEDHRMTYKIALVETTPTVDFMEPASKYRKESKSYLTIKHAEKTCVGDIDWWCKMVPSTILMMDRQDLHDEKNSYIFPKIVCPFNPTIADKDYSFIISGFVPKDSEHLKKKVEEVEKQSKK